MVGVNILDLLCVGLASFWLLRLLVLFSFRFLEKLRLWTDLRSSASGESGSVLSF